MNEMGVIDHFLDVFSRYIDSGFGLLGGEVAYLATALIIIDITLAGLFWAWGADEDVLQRLIRKTLYVGLFAFLIGHWNALARIIFESFAGLGLTASGSGLSEAQFLQPGHIAQTGIDAGKPILRAIGDLTGYMGFFAHFAQIAVLMLAWLIVILAFFLLAVQLFVTLIEFKLTTLAGFVLIPFGLFGKTAFLAERVLGNVMASGIKVLVLAVIVGIGSTLFGEFVSDFSDHQPTLEEAMALALAALTLLGLGLFGPGIANGLISGGPQLGLGAAAGAGLAAGGALYAGAATTRLAAGTAAQTLQGATRATAGAAQAYGAGAAAARAQNSSPTAGGLGQVARSAVSATRQSMKAAVMGTSEEPTSKASQQAPRWAERLRQSQAMKEGVSTAVHVARSADHGGSGASLSLEEKP